MVPYVLVTTQDRMQYEYGSMCIFTDALEEKGFELKMQRSQVLGNLIVKMNSIIFCIV